MRIIAGQARSAVNPYPESTPQFSKSKMGQTALPTAKKRPIPNMLAVSQISAVRFIEVMGVTDGGVSNY
jgi:hypothetical protein